MFTKSVEGTMIEPLIGVMLAVDSLKFVVISNGCTSKESFNFVFDSSTKQTSTTRELSIVRIKPDTCRRLPRTIELEYSLSEVGIKKNESITISNPLSAFHMPTFK
ncbi:MAG: hypothetical protein PVI97_05755 [Candidatus Thiodiazotropha sp.]